MINKPPKQSVATNEPTSKSNQLLTQIIPTESKDITSSPFSFEMEINKIKVPIPFLELLKNPTYKESFMKILQPSLPSPDSINLEDEKPMIYLGNHVEDKDDDNTPPFYLSLNVHDKLLHNFLLDLGASHNLIPKCVMDELGLDFTKEYHDIYNFDSQKAKCLGVIKDLVVTLTQLPMKSIVMDIVVVDIPSHFSMLLSRYWFRKLVGPCKWICPLLPYLFLEGNLQDFIEKHNLLIS